LIRIGTRGSALALAQARWVAERLGEETELVSITTSGDRGAEGADKSRWISELEQALLAGDVDLAVHSAKDVPAELAAGLDVLAIPARADSCDVICGARSLDELAPGARVGTSSLRRMAQLKAAREDLEVIPLRGNVDTRLRKLSQAEADAIVLAAAGLERLGRLDEAGGVLTQLVPAAGQGALLIEGRTGAQLTALNDAVSSACVNAERELVRVLGASCNTPVGAHGRPTGSGEIELTGWAGMPDGSEWISDRLCGAAEGLGEAVARRMLAVGAGELLARAERTAVA
jgi:hydroxymethylbilane synthase